jgi:GDP-L-fucose synthase
MLDRLTLLNNKNELLWQAEQIMNRYANLMEDLNARVYVAGHNGMVGSAITRELKKLGYTNLLLRSSKELDLCDPQAVKKFFQEERPEYVFMAAAKVGGIMANNNYRGEFIFQNLTLQINVIECARVHQVKKLLFMASSCIYPKHAPQPIKEEYLLTGSLEYTNEPYAIAKIAGIKMCEAYRKQYGCNFINVMPTNLYGPNDNYDLEKSHVLPAMIRKFHQAVVNKDKTVVIWGTGTPQREFLYVDDLAEACVFLMKNYNDEGVINIGTGQDLSIGQLATLIAAEVGFKGEIIYDATKPDGTPRKLLDVSKINGIGWKHKTELREGIKLSYQDFLKNINHMQTA